MITHFQATRLGPNSYLLEWSSDDPDALFRVWLNGLFAGTTLETSRLVTVPDNAGAIFHVFEDDTVPAVFQDHAVLLWNRPGGPEPLEYLIEEFIDAAWVERARIPDSGPGQYQYRSRRLEDVTTHQFRLTPLGVNGNPGTPRTYSIFMVRNPDPPSVEYSYDPDTKEITVLAPT